MANLDRELMEDASRNPSSAELQRAGRRHGSRQKPDPRTWMSLSERLRDGYEIERSSDWASAAAHWRNLIDEFPYDERLYRRAITCFLRVGEPLDADDVLSRAVVEATSHDDWQEFGALAERVNQALLSFHSTEARAAYEKGAFLTARDHFREMTRVAPDHPWAEKYLIATYGLADDFEDRLDELDQGMIRKRFYVTGCGRSGTWLLTSMMGCFEGFKVPDSEDHVGKFVHSPEPGPVHLLKRQHDSYRYFSRIPHRISIVNVVRHPFDVLTSRHHDRERYISLERYESEMRAYLDDLIGRPNALSVRFEDLVRCPDDVQSVIAETFGLDSVRPFSDFHAVTDLPSGVERAMHGVRAPSVDSIERWRRSTADRSYLSQLLAQSNGTLERIAALHGYDLALP